MSFSDNFIKRPVLTTVGSILIVLVGLICLALLPLSKLPELAPKKVAVTANYIGADARTTQDNVTTVLEREINGTEGVKWIDSYTDNTGNVTINVSFPTEANRNISQVLVQNRVAQAQSQLPPVVNQMGLKTNTQSPTITLVYAFYADRQADGTYPYDNIFLYNYVDRYIWNELKGLPGVGDLRLLGGAQYAMRIWVDPDRLAARGLTAADVVQAINQQNLDVGIGTIGQQPAPPEQLFERPLQIAGRFTTPQEAEDLVVQVGKDGTLIRVRDIGRAELGMESYSTQVTVDGNPGVSLIIYQLPGSNALETANAVKAKMEKLKKDFPPQLEVTIGLDNTLFVNASLEDLTVTLAQAIGLVILIIFVFLQSWRTTLIPAVAIPVALIGAMIGLRAMDFTLNQLSLFACVLATGLVVDDGIVIVEAISAKLSQGMRPLQASLDAMNELFSASIATSLVLMAVFIPVTFFPGTTGIVYRQFALTIAFAIAFSTFNAISFSPSMSAILLKPPKESHGPLRVFFAGFNRGFGVILAGYSRLIQFLTRPVMQPVVLLIFATGMALTFWIIQAVPQGFIPSEDQGFFFVMTEAPPGVSLNYTQKIDQQITEIVQQMPDADVTLDRVVGLTGFSFEGLNSNKNLTFVKLKDWDSRPGAKKSVFGIIRTLNRTFAQEITGARVTAVNAPAVDGMSNFTGSEIFIQDRQLLGMDALVDNVEKVIAAANKRPEIGQVFTLFTTENPLIQISIDREKANAQNVNISEILNNLRTYLGSNYVNQFVFQGRLYRVYAQAEAAVRSNPKDIDRIYVSSRDGKMVQLSSLLETSETVYPPIITRYNIYPAVKLIVAPAPGYSSGQVIRAMEEVTQQTLQPGFGYEWTNTAAEEIAAGNAQFIVFGLAFVMVFLVLAAQYESYIDPTIILITVPLAILGALGAVWLRANVIQPLNPGAGIWPVLNNDMYCQVALVMLIGLAAKNAILIVEFANQSRDLGMGIREAAISAAKQRFRPIIMTAISSLVGFAPLLFASSVGAISRWSLGTAIFGGLSLATLMSLLLVPNLYIAIKNFEEYVLKGGKPPKSPKPPTSNKTQPTPQLPTSETTETPVLRTSTETD